MSSVPISERRLNEYLNRISEPHIFGPGYWRLLHQDAFDAESAEDIDFFIRRLPRRLETIPCDDCRKHALAYLAENPIEGYRRIRFGVFIWTVKFHNAVNARMKPPKPQVEVEVAKKFYGEAKACTTCGRDDELPMFNISPVH